MGPAIGHGGASTVYRALDVLLGRNVAIKVFTTRAIKPEDLRTQEGEARMLGGLNHPGLVTLLDAGVDLTDTSAPQVFLVMEYVEGSDLRERLRQGGMTAFEVAYLGWDLLTALQYVHERGIIHRDLKPANVLLTEAPGRPARGKLADFGIAVLRDHFSDLDGETTGTAAYLSPEQVEGLPSARRRTSTRSGSCCWRPTPAESPSPAASWTPPSPASTRIPRCRARRPGSWPTSSGA